MKSFSPECCRKHLDQLKTISLDIVTEKYLKDILELAVTVAAIASDIDICFLWLVDDSNPTKKIRLSASHGVTPQSSGKHAFSLNEGMVDFVTHQEKPVIIPNLLAVAGFEEKEIVERCGLHSMIGISLKVPGGTPIGALTCFTTKPSDFSAEEIERIKAVGDKVAITIINTQLMVKTRVAKEELESLKLLGKAREVLMHRQGIGEEEAWGLIRHYCMESLNSPRWVAETILLSDDLEGQLH